MQRFLASLFAFVVSLSAADSARAPVLIELFTSEGCSSCPPADRLLQQLDPRAIVLSEHVDYWNQLGWKDPFSSHASTVRQEDYSHRLNTEGPYTPQMVVDGSTEFNGSDAAKAARAVADASRHPKADVRIARTASGLEVNVSGAPHSAQIFLAIAENAAASQVSTGENQGKHLQHVAVLRSLRKIGSVKKGGTFTQAISAPDGAQRVIVFVQEPDLGTVDGAAEWQQ